MEWLVLAVIFFAQTFISGITKGIQEKTARKNKEEVEGALEAAHVVQEDRLKDEYEATQQQIEEKAVEVTGAQTTALSAMGQGGGAGTAAAGLIEHTEALRTRDQSLLDESYENAQADLDAQHELALTQLEADYRAQEAGIVSEFIASNLNAVTNFGVGTLGIKGPGTILGTSATASLTPAVPSRWNPFRPGVVPM